MGATSAWRVHVIAGLLILLLACSSASAAELDNKGLKLAGEGKWAEAIAQYNKALAKDANYHPALYHLTEAHLALSQDSEAIEYHEKLASLDAGMANELQTSISGSYRRRADAALAAKNYSDAAASYERATALNAALAPELNPNLAAAYAGRGAESRSLADLNKALELRPGFAEAHARRGELYIAQGNNAAGIADLEMAVMLQPDLLKEVVDPLSAALNTRGTVRLGEGAWPDAFVDFGRVIELRDSLGVETPVFALVTSTSIQFSFPVGSGNETLMWNRPGTRDNALEYQWRVETVVGEQMMGVSILHVRRPGAVPGTGTMQDLIRVSAPAMNWRSVGGQTSSYPRAVTASNVDGGIINVHVQNPSPPGPQLPAIVSEFRRFRPTVALFYYQAIGNSPAPQLGRVIYTD